MLVEYNDELQAVYSLVSSPRLRDQVKELIRITLSTILQTYGEDNNEESGGYLDLSVEVKGEIVVLEIHEVMNLLKIFAQSDPEEFSRQLMVERM